MSRAISVDLTIEEIDLIYDAFKSYVQEPGSAYVTSSILTLMLGGLGSKDLSGPEKAAKEQSDKRESKEQSDKASNESEARNRSLIMLRAKLLQARDGAMIDDVIGAK